MEMSILLKWVDSCLLEESHKVVDPLFRVTGASAPAFNPQAPEVPVTQLLQQLLVGLQLLLAVFFLFRALCPRKPCKGS